MRHTILMIVVAVFVAIGLLAYNFNKDVFKTFTNIEINKVSDEVKEYRNYVSILGESMLRSELGNDFPSKVTFDRHAMIFTVTDIFDLMDISLATDALMNEFSDGIIKSMPYNDLVKLDISHIRIEIKDSKGKIKYKHSTQLK